MWALSAWSMMSTGTSSLCARFHSRLRTLWAITPSLSSSAKRRISSSSFSRCFLLALVQLACTRTTTERRYFVKFRFYKKELCTAVLVHSRAGLFLTSCKLVRTGPRLNIRQKVHKQVLLTLKQSKRWSSCSGEKSQASLARRSWTFLTMASCFPAYRRER